MTNFVVGAAKTEYFLHGNSTTGVRLWTSRDYIRIEGSWVTNGVSSLIFYVPRSNYSREDFPIDGIVELWRAPIGLSPSLLMDRLWFIRARFKDIQDGLRVWKIVCYDFMYLLGDPGGQVGRVVAYNSGNSFTHKLDEADDMCKAIMRENLGSLATDTNRDLSEFLSIDNDVSAAPIIRKEFPRRLVLPTLQEIARASLTEGTYLAFDIVCIVPPGNGSFQVRFKTYTGQRGADHRSASNDPVLIIGLTDVLDGVDYTSESNYIYAIGQSIGDVAAVLPAFDNSRVNISPFNRREYVVNASETIDLEALQNEADAALKAGRPKRIISGTYNDYDQARFGVNWDYGDYLTVQVDGESADCRNEAVSFQVRAKEPELLQIVMRGEDVE